MPVVSSAVGRSGPYPVARNSLPAEATLPRKLWNDAAIENDAADCKKARRVADIKRGLCSKTDSDSKRYQRKSPFECEGNVKVMRNQREFKVCFSESIQHETGHGSIRSYRASISRNNLTQNGTGSGEKKSKSGQLGSRRHVDENQPRCGVERYETGNGKPEWQAIGSRFIGEISQAAIPKSARCDLDR